MIITTIIILGKQEGILKLTTVIFIPIYIIIIIIITIIIRWCRSCLVTSITLTVSPSTLTDISCSLEMREELSGCGRALNPRHPWAPRRTPTPSSTPPPAREAGGQRENIGLRGNLGGRHTASALSLLIQVGWSPYDDVIFPGMMIICLMMNIKAVDVSWSILCIHHLLSRCSTSGFTLFISFLLHPTLPYYLRKTPRSGSVMQSYPDIQSFRPPAPSTISPCGSWVLGGSSCGLAIAWNTDTGEDMCDLGNHSCHSVSCSDSCLW